MSLQSLDFSRVYFYGGMISIILINTHHCSDLENYFENPKGGINIAGQTPPKRSSQEVANALEAVTSASFMLSGGFHLVSRNH